MESQGQDFSSNDLQCSQQLLVNAHRNKKHIKKELVGAMSSNKSTFADSQEIGITNQMSDLDSPGVIHWEDKKLSSHCPKSLSNSMQSRPEESPIKDYEVL